jgi:hypothetical protein
MTRTPILITLMALAPLAMAVCGALGGRDGRPPRIEDRARLGSGSAGPDAEGPAAGCRCALARATNGWCHDCGVGYLASIRIPSAALFEALDAHGHAIDPDLLRCDGCKRAIETDAFCDRSGIGYVGGQAYLSKLAYYAARGEMREPSALGCAACWKNAAGHGWCDACGIGRVGCLILESRAQLEEARQAFERLGRALGKLATCETCAVATATGGRCPLCRISYGAELY